MSKYFYAVATLPYISYESETFMEPGEFLELCSYQLTAQDYRSISAVSLVPAAGTSTGSEAGDRFFRFERGVRNALVRHRAQRSGIDASDFISTDRAGNDFSDDTAAAELARTAFSALISSPLQAEEILDRGRWARLDDLEAGHHFDYDNLVIYYLKLLILSRKARRTRELGVEGYEAEYSKITQSMGNPANSGA
ncbi:hypothetical protein [Salinispira pacifica]